MVLVVDDDPDIREALAYALGEEGFDVETAANGQEALCKVERRRPALILLDLMMPVMDGWEMFGRLRERPETERIPVCVVSANAEYAPSGSHCVLEKPLDLDRLIDVVRDAEGPHRR